MGGSRSISRKRKGDQASISQTQIPAEVFQTPNWVYGEILNQMSFEFWYYTRMNYLLPQDRDYLLPDNNQRSFGKTQDDTLGKEK